MQTLQKEKMTDPIRELTKAGKRKYKFGEKMRLAWVFESIPEKILLGVSIIALLYSIIRIIAQGVW